VLVRADCDSQAIREIIENAPELAERNFAFCSYAMGFKAMRFGRDRGL
jgi:hypothetical protein